MEMIINGKEYSEELFKEIVLNSSSYKEIADELGISYNGSNLKKIKKYLKEYQINFHTKYKTKEDIERQNRELLNQNIGRLTILDIDKNRMDQQKIYFICQCSYENNTILSVRKDALLDKKHPTLSCGCLNREAAQQQGIKNREDLQGKTFGKVSVISYNEQVSKKYNRPYWNVKCECGNEYVASSRSIKIGLSCGCLKSKGEYNVAKILTKMEFFFEKEKKFQQLTGDGGKNLRFDFYLPEQNILIECQGKQHYEPVEIFGGKEQFEKQLKNDNLKREYCKENNIKLIEIPYWDYDIINEEYLLNLLN